MVEPVRPARRARVFSIATAVVFAALSVGYIVLGLGFAALLYGGLTLALLTVLLVVAAFVDSLAIRWIAFAVTLVGAAACAVSAFTQLPSDGGGAVTMLFGILPLLALALFVVTAVARAAHRAT
ncbi:hypothetical protein [Microbacterium sp. che218]|uniref:hypothetical protein n=1 Tax=Microbacterium sp. che218 TaxID=3140649 RepID=UPI0033661ADD